MRLQADGLIDLKPIISHVIPFDDAGEAFRILDEEPEKALQVVLDFTKT
jgi:threonine dehydrogenase-like Zn-dependent dehydrogenase